MENEEPEEEEALCVTEELLRDLHDSLRESAIPDGRGRTSYVREAARDWFGRIYFGSLREFAKGSPHYVAVKDLRKGFHRSLKMAPITSKRPKGGRNREATLNLDPGTLPPKRNQQWTQDVTSYVLLFWRMSIPKSLLQGKLEYVRMIPDEKLAEARNILQELDE